MLVALGQPKEAREELRLVRFLTDFQPSQIRNDGIEPTEARRGLALLYGAEHPLVTFGRRKSGAFSIGTPKDMYKTTFFVFVVWKKCVGHRLVNSDSEVSPELVF